MADQFHRIAITFKTDDNATRARLLRELRDMLFRFPRLEMEVTATTKQKFDVASIHPLSLFLFGVEPDPPSTPIEEAIEQAETDAAAAEHPEPRAPRTPFDDLLGREEDEE